MKDYKWLPVDTPSIMFSCLSTKQWGRTCRMAVVLKDRELDETLLRKAVADLRPRFPHYFSKLKRGFFWNYLEQVDGMPEIRPENNRPGAPIVLHNDNRPDFRLVYSGRRLAIEIAHSLTDGHGILTFLLALTQRYLELAGALETKPQNGILFWKDEAAARETEDSFLRYGDYEGEKIKSEQHEVYRLASVYENDFLRLIFFVMPGEQILTKARAMQLTLTEYMTAVCMLAIIRAEKNPIRNSIGVDIPVNLRSFFETPTLRNFVYQVSTLLPVDGRQDWTLEEIADVIRGQIRSQLEPKDLQGILKGLISLAKNPVIRCVPNFIKTPVLRVMQARSHADETTIITNLGNVRISDEMSALIERLDFVNGDTSGYGLPATCSSASINGQFVFCISSNNRDNAVWREMARILSNAGIDIRLECSIVETQEKEEPADAHFACPSCNVSLPAAYACCPLCAEKTVLREGKKFTSPAVAYPQHKTTSVDTNDAPPSHGFSLENCKAYFHL